MRGLGRITKMAVFLAGVLVLAQILVSVAISGTGSTLGKLEKRAQLLDLEDKKLAQTLVSSQALVSVASRASELGFVELPVIYLTPETPIALKLSQ